MKQLPKTGYHAVLSNTAFRVLWINEILVQISYAMVNLALIIRVFNITGKNSVSSLFVLTAVIPAILFGTFTGVAADVFDKRRILLLTDLAIGVCFASFLFAGRNVALILLIAFFLNLAFQFFIPAEAATIPIIVPKPLLLPANALFYIVLTFSAILGYTISGPIVAHLGSRYIFIVAALAMFTGFALRRSLPPLTSQMVKRPDNAGKPDKTIYEMWQLSITYIAEGIVYLRNNIRVWMPVAILVLVQLLGSVLVALGPGFMEQVLHIRATDASIVILLPLGVGLAIGALTVGRFGHLIPRRYLIAFGAILSGVAIASLGITPLIFQTTRITHTTFLGSRMFFRVANVAIIVSMFSVLLGICASCMIVPAQTILQNSTTLSIRGRVFSLLETLKAVVAALPIILAGALADLFGIAPILIVIGCIVFILGLISYRFIAFEKTFT